MTQRVLWLLLVICLGLLLYTYSDQLFDNRQPVASSTDADQSAQLQQLPSIDDFKYVADISLHSADELNLLFDRVEELLERPRSDEESALVSLVLHGPEVEFFVLKNYAGNKSLVDRAAKLEALGAVSISICQTMMNNYGIGSDEVPAFLEQVPYGPDEVKRLIDEGYVYM